MMRGAGKEERRSKTGEWTMLVQARGKWKGAVRDCGERGDGRDILP